jgi:hypothetical protein
MGHFYTQTAEPLYQVPVKSKPGQFRDTNIADARKLKLLPGCTDVIGVADKSDLTRWMINQVLDAAVEYRQHPDYVHLPDTAWKGKVYEKSKEIGERTRNRGNEIHEQFEKTFTDGKIYDKDREFIEPVIQELHRLYPKAVWISEKSYAHRLGYGCRLDLHSKEGEIIVLDFKTKENKELAKVKLYDAHRMQLAANREAAGIPNARCVNILISTTNPQEPPRFHEWEEDEIQTAWKMFQNLLSYWQLKNSYDSSF